MTVLRRRKLRRRPWHVAFGVALAAAASLASGASALASGHSGPYGFHSTVPRSTTMPLGSFYQTPPRVPVAPVTGPVPLSNPIVPPGAPAADAGAKPLPGGGPGVSLPPPPPAGPAPSGPAPTLTLPAR